LSLIDGADPVYSIFQKTTERNQNHLAREKRKRERIVHFSGSRIVTNDFRQFDIGFDFGNCEDPDAFLRAAQPVTQQESVPDPLEHVKWIGYSQRSYCV
jgi:hypothetical protein